MFPPFLFLHLNIICPSNVFYKSMTSFILIIIICTYIFEHMYVILSVTGVHIMSLLCVFSTETVLLSFLQSLLGLRLHGLLSVLVCWPYSCSDHIWQPCWWDFIGIASDVTRRHILTANSLNLWLLTIHILSAMFLSCNRENVLQMYSMVLVSTILHIDWLWFLVMVSVW